MKQFSYIIKYIITCVLGVTFIAGALAVIFEGQLLVRISGAVCALVTYSSGEFILACKK